MYTRSDDGGDNWSAPQIIDRFDSGEYRSEGYGPNLINVVTHGEDEVHLIWDGAPTVERNHIYSTDGGQTWSQPVITFPEITAVGRAGWNGMAFDSAEALHAVSLGGPLHASWTSERNWSSSTDIARTVYDGKGEWLQIAAGLGNQLHVAWVDKDYAPNTVWYVMGQTSAPATAPQPVPIEQPTATPPAQPAPTAPPVATGAPPARVEAIENSAPLAASSPATILGISLAPVALLVGIIVIVSLRRRRTNGGRW